MSKRTCRLSQAQVNLILQKLEAAWTCGRLVLTTRQYGVLLAVLMPEHFVEPPPCAPAVQARELPGTPEKALLLCLRAASRRQLWHRRDPDWVTSDRLGKLETADSPLVVEQEADTVHDDAAGDRRRKVRAAAARRRRRAAKGGEGDATPAA